VKNYKLKQFLENLLLIFIILIIIYFILSFFISTFSITKFKLPSFSMPKFDYNITMPSINTDFLLDKFKKDENISKTIKPKIKETNTSKVIINEDDTNIDIKTFDIDESNNTIKNNISKQNIDTNNTTMVENKETNTSQIVEEEVQIQLSPEEELKKYISTAKELIVKHQNDRKLLKRDIKNIEIKVQVLEDGKFNKLIYLSGNKALIGEARIAVKRTFPIKPKDTIKSEFPIFITLTLTYE